MTRTGNDMPRLSIVVTARNDDHGGDMLRRMQIFTDALLAQATKHRLRCELIIVEWNPPTDRPRLHEALRWPSVHDFCSVRSIEVPHLLHCRYRYAGRLPLFQMIAKNAGIRRARGEFILATNIDIIFSDELFAFMASDRMHVRRLYRVDRWDVDNRIPDRADPATQLAYCETHVVRRNTRHESVNYVTGEHSRIYPDDIDNSPHLLAAVTPLHNNACGDFQLTDRDTWWHVRAYPELEMYSLHIDTIFNLNAHASGSSEVVLPDECRAYHIEHSAGWQPEGSSRRRFSHAMRRRRVPTLDTNAHFFLNMWTTRYRRPRILNNEAWGLGSTALPERAVLVATGDHVRAETQPASGDLRWRRGLKPLAYALFRLQLAFYTASKWRLLAEPARLARLRFDPRRMGKGFSVAVFGAGPSGEAVLDYCRRHGIPVSYLLDNAASLQGKVVRGLKVVAPSSIASAEAAPPDVIVLASLGWQPQMEKQLRALGYRGTVLRA